MGALIDGLGDDALRPPRLSGETPFAMLVRGIVGQQFSTRAAAAMYAKLTARFGERLPTPAEILADDPDALRVAVGLSHAKLAALRSLAEHLLNGSLDLQALGDLPDEEVIAQLTAVRGIGRWTAQLFLIFALGRPDVIASGDLGVRRAIQVQYGLPALPSPSEVDVRAQAWWPYRTAAGLLLWRAAAATPAQPS